VACARKGTDVLEMQLPDLAFFSFLYKAEMMQEIGIAGLSLLLYG
jgi:hypothetical protein